MQGEIDKKIDVFISELLEESGVDNWYYIAGCLESISDFIKNSPSVKMTQDYRDAALKNLVKKNEQ